MKKTIYFAIIFMMMIMSFLYQVPTLFLSASEVEPQAVYFGSRFCQVCQALEETDLAFERLEAQGVIVTKYILEDDTSYTKLFRNYQFTYDVPQTSASVPILFVGKSYFTGRQAINAAIDDLTIQTLSQTESMPDLLTAPPSDFSLIYFILLGFVDGVNPCAIAMLLIDRKSVV